MQQRRWDGLNGIDGGDYYDDDDSQYFVHCDYAAFDGDDLSADSAHRH